MRQALALAAKAPLPGKAKTRLQSYLSAEDATQLYRCFLKDTLALIDSVPDADAVISYTPEGAEWAFEGITGGRHRLLPQRGEDFGERLFYALEDLLREGYGSVAIMDSDSPTLPASYLQLALELLRRPGPRTVLGPALDGGYYLIGVNGSQPRLFQDITWSTSSVLEQTIERARESGLEVDLLPEWYDVDDRESFEWLLCEMGLEASPTFPFDRLRSAADDGRAEAASGLAGTLSLQPESQSVDAAGQKKAPHTKEFLRTLWREGRGKRSEERWGSNL